MMVIGQRTRIVEDTDGSGSQAIDLMQEDEEHGEHPVNQRRGPSKEAIEKFTDYCKCRVREERLRLMGGVQ